MYKINNFVLIKIIDLNSSKNISEYYIHIMSKLLSQGGFGCIYYPGIACHGKPQTNKDFVTKLQKHDETSDNEISFGEKIMTIPNYRLYFLPVVSSCPVNIRSINKKLLEKCETVIKNIDRESNEKERNKYVLMEIPYELNKPFYSIFTDMLFSKKHIIISLIENYTYLLETINLLLVNKLVHFDIKSENILYSEDSHLPLLLDFGISIDMNTLDIDNIGKHFYIYSPDYYLWALEIHVINFLLYETNKPLTLKNIKLISQTYVTNNKALRIFSDDFKIKYLKECETFLEPFVGKNRKETVKYFLSFYSTWDNYSLSILYLNSFLYLFPFGVHNNSVIIYFSQALLYNIHPNPLKRYTLQKTIQLFKDIFYRVENVDNYIDLIETVDYTSKHTSQTIDKDETNLKNTKAFKMRI